MRRSDVESPARVYNKDSPARAYNKVAPHITAVLVKLILTYSDPQAIPFTSIANKDPATFGRPGAERRSIRNHFDYLLQLRKKKPEQFSNICLGIVKTTEESSDRIPPTPEKFPFPVH
jgi:hypothetical protein